MTTHRRKVTTTLRAMLAALAMVAAACSAGDVQPALTVVVTTTPLGDVVRNLVQNDGSVEVLLPIGADSHSYQASSQQVAMIQGADLVIGNGLGLEEGLADILDSAEADGANIFEVAPLLDPMPFPGHDGECDPGTTHAEDDHEPGSCDPHVWMDPIRMGEAARLIAAELAAVDPSIDWAGRAEDYADQLVAADTEITTILSAVAADQRKLVTNHEAFGYFAARYEFEVLGVVIPGGSTLAEPSSAELAELVEEIRRQDVAAIFAETSEPSRLAEAVASEVGDDVAVVELYSESLGEPGSAADTLIGMLTTNARLIADALS